MLATGMPIERGLLLAGRRHRVQLTTLAMLVRAGVVGTGRTVRGRRYRRRMAGTRSARHLAERRGALNIVVAVVICGGALYAGA
jgi:hypothetical protein